jgi:hypothetical protein
MSRLIQIDWQPPARRLRQFGFIALGVCVVLAWAAWQQKLIFSTSLGAARSPVTFALLALGSFSALAACIAPSWNRPLYLGLSVLGYPVGAVVSYLLMATIFFGVLAPIGIVLRLLGRDPLQRRRSSASSYWTAHRQDNDPQRYFRQF